MKKIPTLFEREYENHKVIGIKPIVTPGMQWVLDGEGEATLKMDGSCCAMIDHVFYKRYDAKKGKKAPADAIPCQPEPDPITGHWPHWVPVDDKNPADKWFVEAYKYSRYDGDSIFDADATFEAVGLHFQGNPYHVPFDFLTKHGAVKMPDFPRTFEGMKKYFEEVYIEGVVFWKDGEPQCKIKRSDFGFPWNER